MLDWIQTNPELAAAIGVAGFSLTIMLALASSTRDLMRRVKADLEDAEDFTQTLLHRNRELNTQRVIAEAQLRDTRTALAIERARVDHLIDFPQHRERTAARAALPFPDFGVEPAGVRTVDEARRRIEATRNGTAS